MYRGRTRLANLNFGTIYHRFTRNFAKTGSKKSKWPYNNNTLYWKLFQPMMRWSSTLNSSWSNFKWVLFMNYTIIKVSCMQRSRKWVLPNWIELFLPPLVYTNTYPYGLYSINTFGLERFKSCDSLLRTVIMWCYQIP